MHVLKWGVCCSFWIIIRKELNFIVHLLCARPFLSGIYITHTYHIYVSCVALKSSYSPHYADEETKA